LLRRARLALLLLASACRGPALAPPVDTQRPTSSASAAVTVGMEMCGVAATRGVSERRVNAAGERRSYRLIVPESFDGTRKARLLLGFHGYGQSLDSAASNSLVRQATAAGYLVALPQGGSLGPSPPCWNAGSCCAPCSLLGFDDVALADAVIDDVKASFCVDADRVYVAGFSNGAMLAYRLACTLGSELAAVVAVSGTMLAPECNGDVKSPPALLIAHGTADDIVPIAGGTPSWAGGLPFDWPGMVDVAARARAILGCSEQHESSAPRAGWVRDSYGDCKRGELEVHTIEKGGHTWPRGGFNEDVLSFFERNPRRR
jgi:polyhydroxybutyrate depolymerase